MSGNYFKFESMKKLMLLFIACLLFNTCKKSEPVQVSQQPCETDIPLTSDELAWNPYTFYQSVIFKSNSGLTDTGIVEFKIDTIDPEVGGPCVYLYQALNVYIGGFKTCTSGYFQIDVEHNNKFLMNGFAQIEAPYDTTGGWVYGDFSQLVPQNNITIDSIVRNNVYVITADTSNWASHNSQGIWRMYYTRQNGLLEFDYFHGLSWVKI